MRRIISLVLVFSIFGSLIHLDELSKVTYLIKHYMEHRESNNRYSFYAFFKDHYIDEHYAFSKKDNKSHSQLPYKSNKTNKVQIDLFAVQPRLSQNTIIIPPLLNPQNNSFEIPLGFFKIWQPPKIG